MRGRTSAPAVAAAPNKMHEWEERHVPGAGERGDGVQGMDIEVEVHSGGELESLESWHQRQESRQDAFFPSY